MNLQLKVRPFCRHGRDRRVSSFLIGDPRQIHVPVGKPESATEGLIDVHLFIIKLKIS